MARPKTLPYEAAEEPVPYYVELHSTAGGSDKIYQIAIVEKDGGWLVNYANGRRGGTLSPGTKTTGGPVEYAAARTICNKLLFEKVGGGYLPIGGSRYGDSHRVEAIQTVERSSSGQIPQLLSALDEQELERLLRDDDYAAERKHDGERRILIVENGVARGGNRLGQSVALPARLAKAAAGFPDVVLDGEQIGDVFHFWDMLEYKGVDLRKRPLEHRLAALDAGKFDVAGLVVRSLPARGEEAKRRLLAETLAASGEGIVLKRLDAAYDPGKPGGQASWRKYKFWHSLSAVVEGVKKGRSVSLCLFDDAGGKVHVGGVTIPANHPMPEPGTVVEIRYLYAFDGGGLHQPVYMGARTDIPASDCLASQRAFKPVPAALAVEPEEEMAAPAP